MGKVCNDPFGLFLKQTLDNNNVDTSKLIVDTLLPTTLAFVSLQKTGDRDFIFFRGAHEAFTKQEVVLSQNLFLVHFGSLLQTTPANRTATEYVIAQARKRNAIVSYDPNVREALWRDLSELKRIIFETIPLVDILKLSDFESMFLTG